MERTSKFLLAQPSSNAGNSTPLSRLIARRALSGSSYSAKPKPWGLLAGVMRRLNEVTLPHAYEYTNAEKRDQAVIEGGNTERSSLMKESVTPPDIEPTKSLVCFCACGGTKCMACCCAARADIEGPWPNDGKGGRRPSPIRFGIGCIMNHNSWTKMSNLET